MLWADIAGSGAPLIEPDDADHSLVTFLWRGGETTENVLLLAWLSGQGPLCLALASLPGTHVWYKTHCVRNTLRSAYEMFPNAPLVEGEDATEMISRLYELSGWQPDPLNPRTFGQPPGHIQSVLALPNAPPERWAEERQGEPKGELTPHRFDSELLGNARVVWVYTPPGYVQDDPPCDLLVVFDGWAYVYLVPVPTILDNLLAKRLIQPTIAVMVTNPEGTRNNELACDGPFADMLVQEFLPWLRERYTVTVDPARTVIAGSSLGALAASFSARRHPDVFGNVLSQSGSYWWGRGAAPPARIDAPSIESEWLIDQFALSGALPLRFYVEVGLLEAAPRPGRDPDQVVSNRRMRDVLRGQGYEVHYSEFYGGHDYLCWRATFGDALLHLMGPEE